MTEKQKGTLYVILGAIAFSGSGVLGKYTSWSGLATAGIRALVAVFIMAAARGGFHIHLTGSNLLGAFGCASTSILFVIANKLTTSANAIVLQYAMPAVVIFLCWMVYGQKPGKTDIVTALLVLTGVILCCADQLSGGKMLGNLLAFFTAFTFALVFFCSRLPDADAETYNFLGLIFCTPFSLFAIHDPGAVFTVGNVLALFGLGCCLAGGYFFLSKGMKTVSPVSAALTANIEPVLNPLWTFLFLSERPGILAIIGAALVLCTVTVYSIWSGRNKTA